MIICSGQDKLLTAVCDVPLRSVTFFHSLILPGLFDVLVCFQHQLQKLL